MKVLLGDDDDRVRDSLTSLLKRLGHDVWTVDSGEALVAVARDVGGFDLAISDFDYGLLGVINGSVALAELEGVVPARALLSGLERPVPEGARFFSKSDLLSLLDYVDHLGG